ncbi:MAG: hypothetical protein NTX70_02915 [Verrucomicrobia bacterium]|nr:hypothetical protein [Verrucomicrobiota bacterium]
MKLRATEARTHCPDEPLVSSQVTLRRLGASLAQRVDEALAICIIHEDQFAPVTTILDVRQQTRLSICGPCWESVFGRYTNIKN